MDLSFCIMLTMNNDLAKQRWMEAWYGRIMQCHQIQTRLSNQHGLQASLTHCIFT
jgi:hypothetical protein